MFGNKEKQVIKNISKSTWWSIKVISSLADDIEDKEEKEEEKIQFNLKIASAKVTKAKAKYQEIQAYKQNYMMENL